MAKFRVTANPSLNVRRAASVGAERVGVIPQGVEFESAALVSDTWGNVWHALDISVGGAGVRDFLTQTQPARAYAAHVHSGARLTEPVDVAPPPPVGTRYRIGVHCIGDHDAAKLALESGAPGVVIMDDKTFAVQMAASYPGRAIVYRRYIGTARPSPADFVAAIAPNRNDPPIWFVGLNEDESYGSDPAAIRARAVWDGEVFRRIMDIQPNARYFGGSFSHGAPGQIEDKNGPVFAAAMDYAALWRAGMGMDFHNYTRGRRYTDDPPSDAPIVAPQWYENRHRFWIDGGILVGPGGGIIHGETGVEAGAGGYNWANYAPWQFARHIRNLRELGRTIDSPEVMGFIFQFGGDTNWQGYDVRRYLPELKAFWQEP